MVGFFDVVAQIFGVPSPKRAKLLKGGPRDTPGAISFVNQHFIREDTTGPAQVIK